MYSSPTSEVNISGVNIAYFVLYLVLLRNDKKMKNIVRHIEYDMTYII